MWIMHEHILISPEGSQVARIRAAVGQHRVAACKDMPR